jgi:hypothetical protein
MNFTKRIQLARVEYLKARTWKEGITMKYNKPEVVAMAEAVRGIQGQMTKSVLPADNNPSTIISTPTAYEADE